MEAVIISLLILILIFQFYNFLKTDNLMASVKDLSAKVDELQTALDSEQEQIKSAIDTLQATVDNLTQQLADGGTAEERQAVLDKINSVIEDLKGTIPDAQAPTE